MSAFFLRPVVSYPVRCAAPAVFHRPTFATPHDFAPLFSLFDESFAQLEQAHRQARRQVQQQRRPFNPKFDVKETKEAYSLEGELPGFDAKDVSIEFLDDGYTLQIKGKTVKDTKREHGTPQAIESAEAPKAVESAPAEQPSETSSVKSHQATVEDDVEEPANASAVTEQPKQHEQQVVTETAKAPEQQSEQQQSSEPDTKQWISERYTGTFSRSFKFPSKVDQEAVKASLKDGILAVTLPFARKPGSRRIQIE